MTVVVTGGLGFLGLNVVRALAAAGTDVVAVDRREPDDLARAVLANLPGRVDHHVADISAPAWTGPEVSADAVVHAAAVTLIGPAEETTGAAAAASVNVVGTANLVAWTIAAGVRRVVHVSSAAVYGPATGRRCIDESTLPEPETIYGITKLAGEQVARRLADAAGRELVVARLSHLFGPMERPGPSRSTPSPVHGWVESLVGGAPLHTTTGRLARDFLYVVDAAEALVGMIFPPLGPHRVFNVASGTSVTDAEAIAVLASLDPSATSRVEDLGAVTSRPPLRTDRLRAWTGWAPRFDFAAACRDYLAWRHAVALS